MKPNSSLEWSIPWGILSITNSWLSLFHSLNSSCGTEVPLSIMHMMCLVAQSCLTLSNPVTHLLTVTRQVPLSTGFSRQEYWSGLPCPSPIHTASGVKIRRIKSLIRVHLYRVWSSKLYIVKEKKIHNQDSNHTGHHKVSNMLPEFLNSTCFLMSKY